MTNNDADMAWKQYNDAFSQVHMDNAGLQQRSAASRHRSVYRISDWPVRPPVHVRFAETKARQYMTTTYHGYGRHNQPVLYESGGRMSYTGLWYTATNQAEFDTWLGLRLEHELRRASIRNPDGPSAHVGGMGIYVTDAAGYSFDNMKLLNYTRAASTMYDKSQAYTKPLDVFIMINISPAMCRFVSVIRRLVQRVAVHTEFVGTQAADISETLAKYINKHEIPNEYGGECKLANCEGSTCIAHPPPRPGSVYAQPMLDDRRYNTETRTLGVGASEHIIIRNPGLSHAPWGVAWHIYPRNGYALQLTVEYALIDSGAVVKSTRTLTRRDRDNTHTTEINFGNGVQGAIPESVRITIERCGFMMASGFRIKHTAYAIKTPPPSSVGACGCYLGPTICK